MTKEDKKIRIAGYARVSTDLQAEKGESLNVQEEDIKRYAAAHGYILAAIYTDKGVSGAKESRPQLDRLRNDAKEGKFDKVVFTKLSRFGRNTRNLLELFQEFEDEYKVGIVCIKENFDTSTSSGRFLRTLLAAVAEFERDTIRTQMKEGKLARLKRNETFTGRAPFGYRFNKEKREMEVVDEEKETYLKIINMYLDKKMSFTDIIIELTRSCAKSPNGRRWSTLTLSYIMKNSCYKGELIMNRFVYVNSNRTKEEKPEEEWIRYTFPAFIDEYKWDLLQKRIEFNSRKPKNEKYPHLFLVSGLVRCGVCGASVGILNGHPRQDGDAPHYYACFYARASKKSLEVNGRKRCSLPHIPMEDVDGHLWGRMMNLLTYPEDTLKKAMSEGKDSADLLKEKERVESELKTSERKAKRLVDELTDEEDADLREQIKNNVRELNKYARERKNRLSEIEQELITMENDREVLEGFNLGRFRKEIKKCLNSIPGIEKKHLIRILVAPETGGHIILRQMTEGDRQLDDKVFMEGKVKANDSVPGSVVADFSFKLQGEKIIAAYEYLKNKGFLSDKVIYKVKRKG